MDPNTHHITKEMESTNRTLLFLTEKITGWKKRFIIKKNGIFFLKPLYKKRIHQVPKEKAPCGGYFLGMPLFII